MRLAHALTIIEATLAEAGRIGLAPLAVTVLDAGGHVVASQRQDGASIRRLDVAVAKAYGAIALGLGSRALMRRAEDQPYFIAAVGQVLGGQLVPVPGGVLVHDGDRLVGSVGVSGDTSDRDELVATTGIEAAGYTAFIG